MDKERLQTLLDEAIALDGATKGNIQAFDRKANVLRLVAQRGFDEKFLRHFETVKPFDTSACGRAMGIGGCVIVPDVMTDQAFAPHRLAAISAEFRSVKSVPVAGPDGAILGVLSTHHPGARYDWERDNTRRVAAEIAAILAQRTHADVER